MISSVRTKFLGPGNRYGSRIMVWADQDEFQFRRYFTYEPGMSLEGNHKDAMRHWLIERGWLHRGPWRCGWGKAGIVAVADTPYGRDDIADNVIPMLADECERSRKNWRRIVNVDGLHDATGES